MALRKSKIYKLIVNGSREALVKGMLDYLNHGKSPNIRDPLTGGNLLHHIVDHGHRFHEPEALTLVYMLACKDVEIDAQDNHGDTCLHKVVRLEGCHRLMISFIRCGIDTSLRNDEGLTPEDILLKQKPNGWETNLHFYNKFKPGLYMALKAEVPDRKLIERLLQSWCRTTSVKDGKVTCFKSLLGSDIKKTDILQLLEKYENTVELALAVIGGVGMIVRMWMKQGILVNFDACTSDISYVQRYPHTPTVPQPILAATWETNSFSAVDVLMELKTNPNVLYSPNPPLIPPRPLFFNVLDSEYRPTDIKIIERIFEGSDLTARNSEGQTILYELIERNEGDRIVRFALIKGADPAARDRLGRTARDFAAQHGRQRQIQLIDEYVIRLVKTKKLEAVERLILDFYDHLPDTKDMSGKSLIDIAKKNSTKQMHDVIRLAGDIQTYVKRVFRAVDEGALDDLKKLLSCRKYVSGRYRAGRTPLLKAIQRRHKDLVLYLAEEHSHIINHCDNMHRSVLHYANLFLDDPEVLDVLEKHGADPAIQDVRGLKADAYRQQVCPRHDFLKYVKEVEDVDLEIYLRESNFDVEFRTAIQAGNFDAVEKLITDVKEYGDVSRYSNLLFDCIDGDHEDIAVFLLMAGFNSDIYRQYDRCDPRDPMCAMMECGHGTTSLRERANQKNCKRVVKLIDDLKKGGNGVKKTSSSRI